MNIKNKLDIGSLSQLFLITKIKLYLQDKIEQVKTPCPFKIQRKYEG